MKHLIKQHERNVKEGLALPHITSSKSGEKCLFCNKYEQHNKNSQYLCSHCLQELIKFSQEELQAGLRKVKEILCSVADDNNVFKRKQMALELLTGGKDGIITECVNGRRFRRTVRDNKKSISGFKKQQKTTFRKDK